MDISILKKLRAQTNVSIMECKKALEEAGGDVRKAEAYLQESAKMTQVKRNHQQVSEGIIASYIHINKRIGSMVEVHCETDFVARTPEFSTLAYELALHIAGMNPKTVKDLLAQPYVRNPSINVKDLISEMIRRVGENIKVARFIRYAL